MTRSEVKPPELGDEYESRTEIAEVYGGNKISGIIRFPGDQTVNAFSDEAGPYADEPPDTRNPFGYRGAGQNGHQTLVRGNKLLDDARRQQHAVRFWYRPLGEKFRFFSWVAVLDRAQVWSPDQHGELRLEYTFLLATVADQDPASWPAHVLDLLILDEITDEPPPRPHDGAGTSEPARVATYRDYVAPLGLPAGSDKKRLTVNKVLRNNYQRSRRARDAVLIRANNRCENLGCTGMPPDTTASGDAILEVDHVDDLARGGPDHPSQMIALCPNCHGAKTRGKNRATLRRKLRKRAAALHDQAMGADTLWA